MDSNVIALLNEMYNKQELEDIKKVKDKITRYEEIFTLERNNWDKHMEEITNILKNNANNVSREELLEAQALSLSYRQKLNDTITKYLNRHNKEKAILTELEQEKTLYYLVGFAPKGSAAEKNKLLSGHTAQYERSLSTLESQIDFLRTTAKNFEAVQYAIKAMIELIVYLKQ